MINSQTQCLRCGTCCANGGPALHNDDLSLLLGNTLPLKNILTIRKGEPAFSPIENAVLPSQQELLKIKGCNNTWQCMFYSVSDKSCGIYLNRPIECETLKCWDPSDLKELIFKNTLCRKDILKDNDQIIELIDIHERNCSFKKLLELNSELQTNREEIIEEIKKMIEWDLLFRQNNCQKLALDIDMEMVYFGRPLFKSLAYFGLSISENSSGISINRLDNPIIS